MNCFIIIFLCVLQSGTMLALGGGGDNRQRGLNGSARQNARNCPLGNRSADRPGVRRFRADALHRGNQAGRPSGRRTQDRTLREIAGLERQGDARHRKPSARKPQIPRRPRRLVHALHAARHDGTLRHQTSTSGGKVEQPHQRRQRRPRASYPRERANFRDAALCSRSHEQGGTQAAGKTQRRIL
jgi:hypothetical protein